MDQRVNTPRTLSPVEADVVARFHERQRARLRSLASPEVIAEHRDTPVGNHSPGLSILLTWLRQAPTLAKLALLETTPGEEWVVVRLSGSQGVPHHVDDTKRHATLEAALHAVFLQRLAESGLLNDSGEAP